MTDAFSADSYNEATHLPDDPPVILLAGLTPENLTPLMLMLMEALEAQFDADRFHQALVELAKTTQEVLHDWLEDQGRLAEYDWTGEEGKSHE